jgi:hypothetical protein
MSTTVTVLRCRSSVPAGSALHRLTQDAARTWHAARIWRLPGVAPTENGAYSSQHSGCKAAARKGAGPRQAGFDSPVSE